MDNNESLKSRAKDRSVANDQRADHGMRRAQLKARLNMGRGSDKFVRGHDSPREPLRSSMAGNNNDKSTWINKNYDGYDNAAVQGARTSSFTPKILDIGAVDTHNPPVIIKNSTFDMRRPSSSLTKMLNIAKKLK